MRRSIYVVLTLFLFFVAQGVYAMYAVQLPAPRIGKSMSLNAAIHHRRSMRQFNTKKLLNLKQLSLLLWAGQGITDSRHGFRSSPSAGAIYPLHLYLVNSDGAWKYLPHHNQLNLAVKGDLRTNLTVNAFGQEFIRDASAVIVIVGDIAKTKVKYKDRADRYVYMEAGHVAENILLEATALRLAAVPIGAFADSDVASTLNLPKNYQPLYIIPVGYRK